MAYKRKITELIYDIEIFVKSLFFSLYFIMFSLLSFYNFKNWGQSWRRGTMCACKSTGGGFDPHSRRWNIYLHLYFYFFALVSRGKRGVEFRRRQKLAESGERSVLTLGSLCLPCCAQDTAWSQKKRKKLSNNFKYVVLFCKKIVLNDEK